MNLFKTILRPRLKPNGVFHTHLKKVLGFTPKDWSIYSEAFTHRSMNIRNEAGISVNFERLEFLGDAMLSTIISAFLYRHYTDAKEGELTNLRAKIVSRENLNTVGTQMKLLDLVESTHPRDSFGIDINGNLLEALVGAIFLERGYESCKKFVLKKIVDKHVNLETLDTRILSYKSTLIEWAQKNKVRLKFYTQKDEGLDPNINYATIIKIDDRQLVKARGISKKKSEEKAAKRAYYKLKL